MPLTCAGEQGAAIGYRDIFMIMFLNVADYHPRQWPDPAFPQQLRLDIGVDEVDVAGKKLLAMGAKLLQCDERPVLYSRYFSMATAFSAARRRALSSASSPRLPGSTRICECAEPVQPGRSCRDVGEGESAR